MEYISRYSSRTARLLDFISFLFIYPWLSLASASVSCFLPVLKERQELIASLYLRYLVYGPILAIITIIFLPIAVIGFFLSVIICQLCQSTHFSSVKFEKNNKHVHQEQFNFATMNILLGQEALGRFNNIDSVYYRLKKFANLILDQDEHELQNMCEDLDKTDSVLSNFPKLGFICFQEVHDRFLALALIYLLRQKYSHFLFDIGVNSSTSNMFMGGSGLMLASTYPILAATFHPFTTKRGWQHMMSYGVLVCKLDLGNGRVGLLSNLHTMAYQESEPLIDLALTEVLDVVNQFKQNNEKKEESLIFDVIGGDFNVDNMSPGDMHSVHNQLFQEYVDPASIRPGEDTNWAIGTECRQLTLGKPEMRDRNSFRDILIDDVRRRHYVLDADVEQQTFDLMIVEPKPDDNGRVVEEPWGGMRRIDRLIYRDIGVTRVAGVGFVSAFAGLTDHIPVVLSLKTK